MGILMKFAQARINEVTSEAKKFLDSPLSYLQTNEPVRKMVLLEVLDYIPTRQRQLTNWEHKIAEDRV